jgi:uncharacterized membrane protein YecN with MAPEG domain
MILPITGVFAAVIGILLLVLSAVVVKYRIKYGKDIGTTEDLDFKAAVRAHGNLMEYAPLTLLMLGIAELNGVSSGFIYWVGMAFVLGRILHAWGMFQGQGGPHKARMVGILLTWATILITAVLLLHNVYKVFG